jgi:UPF0755 protein
MRFVIRLLVSLGWLLLLALVIGLAALLYQLNLFLESPLTLTGEGHVVLVRPGMSLKQLADELNEQGILSNAYFLYGYARLTERANRIKAGEFMLPQGATPRDLLDILEKGLPVQHRLTVIEGWTFKEMLSAARAHQALQHSLEGLSPDQVMDKLGHAGEHPEGRFYPDTYSFTRGMNDLELLQRAYLKMDDLLVELWEQRNSAIPLRTPYEALILASIIEKETALSDERPEISGVFTRRLQKGMLLQTDPTVIYGMGDAFAGNIRRKDLTTDTPYNTYTRKGLPPTPICLPGRASLEAALHPKEGDSLYFVASGDGGHVFSPSLKEHNKAVRQHQLKKVN